MVKKTSNSSRLPILIAVASGAPQQGKSTLIMLLAGIMTSLTGMKVLVAELEESGKISRLRQKEISSFSEVPVINYDIIQIAPSDFHSSVFYYTHAYDLIFIEIPNSDLPGTFADVLLLSQAVLCPIVAQPENLTLNTLFFEKLSKLQDLKNSRKLPFMILGLFNKFRPGQDAGAYLQMADPLKVNLFKSFLRFSLNYQIDLSSVKPVLPENSLEELMLVAKEFASSILQ